jgi:hypothetical protein
VSRAARLFLAPFLLGAASSLGTILWIRHRGAGAEGEAKLFRTLEVREVVCVDDLEMNLIGNGNVLVFKLDRQTWKPITCPGIPGRQPPRP